jgi:hypothetical protein
MGHSIEEGRGGQDLRQSAKGDSTNDVAAVTSDEEANERVESKPMVTYATRPKRKKGEKKK